VVLEIGVLAESSVAEVTPEWPGSAVYVHVTLQIARGRKRLRTQLTLVGLLLFMCQPKEHNYIIILEAALQEVAAVAILISWAFIERRYSTCKESIGGALSNYWA